MSTSDDSRPRPYHGVMVSSTFTDLKEHRAVLMQDINRLGLKPVVMEYDSAKADVDVIDSSLRMVREASAYIAVIGHKYGQIPECSIRNPNRLSITELEFDEALSLSRPVLLFIMGDSHPVQKGDIERDNEKEAQLEAFRERAKQMRADSKVHRVYSVFESLDEFKSKATQALAELRPFLGQFDAIDVKAKSPVDVTSSLPPIPAYCFGRDADIDLLITHLLQSEGVAVPVLGSGGIGKSTFVLWALNDSRVETKYQARRYFVGCDGLKTRSEVAGAIVLAMGLTPTTNNERVALASLQANRSVIVLDNFETPWEADTIAVEELLRDICSVNSSTLIVTIRGEQIPAPGVVRWTQPFDLKPLGLDAARETFLAVSKNVVFESDPRLDDLLSAVGCVPLAVVLLAYASQGEPDLDGIWSEWQLRRTELLKRAGGLTKDTNLEVSFELSINSHRMSVDAKTLLSLLGTLPAGVAREDLQALLPDKGSTSARTLQQVGLAYYEHGRIRMLAPLRSYVERVYPLAAKDRAVRDRFYLRMAEMASAIGKTGGDEALRKLAPEIANIECVLAWQVSGTLSEKNLDAVLGWGSVHRHSGLGSMAPMRLAEARLKNSESHWDLARVQLELGSITSDRGDFAEASRLLVSALWGFRSLGEAIGEANCISEMGDIALRRYDLEGASKLFQEALPLLRHVKDRQGEGNTTMHLGGLELRRRRFEKAENYYKRAEKIYRETDDNLGIANCKLQLAHVAIEKSEYDRVIGLLESASALYSDIGSLHGKANVQSLRGELALRQGAFDAARKHFDTALDIQKPLGDIIGQTNSSLRLGTIAFRQGRVDDGEAHLATALELARRVADPYATASVLRAIAINSSDHPSKVPHINEAMGLFRSISRDDLAVEMEGMLGNDSRGTGEVLGNADAACD